MSDLVFPPWRQRMLRSLHLNRSQPQSKYYQVAGLSDEGRPTNRTMVFRGFKDKTNDLLSITDLRSDKVAAWHEESESLTFIEICWYFAKTREQYRISAKVATLTHSVTDEHDKSLRLATWNKLSNNAKEAFSQPSPGIPFNNANESGELSYSETMKESSSKRIDTKMMADKTRLINENFVVTIFTPYKVDFLDLKSTPHNRLISKVESGWKEQKVFA